MAGESKQNVTIDGEERLEIESLNVALLATRLGGKVDIEIGPDGEWALNYDSDSGNLEVTDPSDSVVLSFNSSDNTAGFSSAPLVPEYDSASNAPEDPRAIVRFTTNTSYTAGLYSYSTADGKWNRVDAEP